MQRRVYEYTDEAGNVYYSFTRLPKEVTVGVRLRLHSRVGVHYQNFLSYLRSLALGDQTGK